MVALVETVGPHIKIRGPGSAQQAFKCHSPATIEAGRVGDLAAMDDVTSLFMILARPLDWSTTDNDDGVKRDDIAFTKAINGDIKDVRRCIIRNEGDELQDGRACDISEYSIPTKADNKVKVTTEHHQLKCRCL